VAFATVPRAFFLRFANSFQKSRGALLLPHGPRVALNGRMRGFSLLEVLVATTIVTVGVGALAQLVALTTQTERHAKQMTTAAVLAQEKIEELLPDAAVSAAASPPDALSHNVDGYADFADAVGRVLGAGPTAPAGSAYLRRWSIDHLANGSKGTWIVQVLVTDLRSRTVTHFVSAKMGKAF
jgi:prepilin-type N-terminal cleavage/methylation domain-containing protein